jgi:hypothetical protein
VTFHPLEDEIISGFDSSRPISSEWENSPLKDLVVAAPATKGRFAREIIEQLAAAADVTFGHVRGHTGSRVRVGSAACEIKFSTEDPARFQQVRLPSDGYDYLIGIGAHPRDLVYWLIPADDVQKLIDEEWISYQHAETSLWFFPDTTDADAFAPYRMRAEEVIAKFRDLT